MTPYQEHYAKWSGCTACELHKGRGKIVLARGKVPCDILFIGEAPGESEDALGVPFIGPAGKLLDQIISKSGIESLYRIAFTNLVACFPEEQKRDGTNAPPDKCIRACEQRLKEFVRIAQPKVIVNVGDLAHRASTNGGQARFAEYAEDGSPYWLEGKLMHFIDIVHPAAILRANLAQRGLMKQRCIVTLTNQIADKLGR